MLQLLFRRTRRFFRRRPDPVAQAHSEQLQRLIRAEIEANGPISFARFMEMTLYQPGLGYYSAGARKLGADGDFMTAPEISPLFSQCLATQCAQILSNIGGNILELGAGTGVMAKDILLELAKHNHLPEHYYILEVSADLRQRQKNLLQQHIPQFFSRIHWLDSLPKEKFQGTILANEVLDAMPVHKFKIQDGVKEYYITSQNEKFIWHLAEPTHALKNYLQQLNLPFAEDYESEAQTNLSSWLASIHDCMQQGLLLIIDYGFLREEYYHAQRSMGTLMCHYQHRAHSDPLILPGLQDITAHVDFTAVMEAAKMAHFEVGGYTTQANFLLDCDIIARAGVRENPQEQYQISQQLKQLLFPSEMGELCKAIALTKNLEIPLLGFSH